MKYCRRLARSIEGKMGKAEDFACLTVMVSREKDLESDRSQAGMVTRNEHD